MNQPLFDDICHSIEHAARGKPPSPESRFHKHDQYLSHGLKTADFWKIMKRFKPRIVALTLAERLNLAAALLAQHIGELGHAGIHTIALSVDDLGPDHGPYLDRVAGDFRSWSHVDHFCGDVIRPLLNSQLALAMDLVNNWNGSPNRWKRRASVVTFTRSAGESGRYTDDVLRLCDNLIWDDEDIVRKGVGWALKDNLRSAPERILPYIKDLRRQGVSSTITLYAIRDLKGPQRQEVLAIKKGGAFARTFSQSSP